MISGHLRLRIHMALQRLGVWLTDTFGLEQGYTELRKVREDLEDQIGDITSRLTFKRAVHESLVKKYKERVAQLEAEIQRKDMVILHAHQMSLIARMLQEHGCEDPECTLCTVFRSPPKEPT